MTTTIAGKPARPASSAPAAGGNPFAAAKIDELGQIIETYSRVTERLQQSHAQLQETVQKLRNELSEKNRLLERRNRLAALGEMAAGMAHEIRNPLGAIVLYASMLANDVREAPESLSLVRKISAGVARLESLVSQVLQFTREISARPVEADLAALVDQAVELTSEQMKSAGITCRVEGSRPMPLRLDPLLMGQAVLNLLINAIEAIPAGGGLIEIAWAAVSPGRCRLIVTDSGPGIPADLLDRVFNPFFTTKETGTGLGLAIVHRIVEAHEGTITAGNSPSGGAIFEIRL